MANPLDADGGDGLQIWRVDADILNKLSRAADKEWSSQHGVGRGTNNSSPQKKSFSYEMLHRALDFGGFFGYLTQDRDQWRDFVNAVINSRVL
jgi:hypothetical protein